MPILVPGSILVKNNVLVQRIDGVSIQNLNLSGPFSDVQYNETTPLFTLLLATTVGIGAALEQYNSPTSHKLPSHHGSAQLAQLSILSAEIPAHTFPEKFWAMYQFVVNALDLVIGSN